MFKKKNREVRLPPFEVKHTVSTLSQTIDWGLMNLNIPNTWTVTKGKGITVLVIDTGCPVSSYETGQIIHPDLRNNIITYKCYTFVDGEGIEDLQGHGSHVCGIIAAENNSIGCVGYAPEATIVTYKGLNRSGVGDIDNITKALECAADFLKPDIIVMSLGATIPDTKMHKAIKKLYKMDIPIIAAAGNGGEAEGVNYPAKYDEVISIGAYDKYNNVADFSAVGEGVDFIFPGVEIYSTYLNNRYVRLSGSSMAAPAAAGVVALLLSKHKIQQQETGSNDCKTVEQIREHLKKYSTNANNKDLHSGWGIIDAESMILGQKSIQTKKVSLWSRFTIWIKNLFK